MLDNIIYSTLHWLMKWSGKINSWSWRKHVKHIEKKRQQEDEKIIHPPKEEVKKLKKKFSSNEDLFNGA